MAHTEVDPYIPTNNVEQAVYDYYAAELRNPAFMRAYITERFERMTSDERVAFTRYHAALFPGDIPRQAQAARRTLLAPYIGEQAMLTIQLNESLYATEPYDT